MTRSCSALVLAAALVLCAACSYSYRNPSEQLRAGEVGGRAVVAAVPRAGVAVSVKGSTLAQGTRSTGRFLLLPLPAGTHTLLLRNGTGGLTARDVEIRYGRDGQPEGIWLGDVPVPPASAAATVSGSVTGPSAPEFVYVRDERTGTTRSFQSGSFRLDGLSVGEHTLTFTAWDGNTWEWFVGGPVTVKVTDDDAGYEKTLASVALHLPSADPDVNGRLKVRLAAIGNVDLAAYSLSGLPGGATPDSTGLVDVTAPEGLYRIEVVGSTASADLPPAVTVGIVAGRVTDLGTLYVTALDASAAVSLACASDADCAPGVCVDRTCQGAYTPPQVAPVSYPLCDTQNRFCSIGSPCAPQYASFNASCVDGGDGLGVCIPDGTCCTIDGVNVLCGAPAGLP